MMQFQSSDLANYLKISWQLKDNLPPLAFSPNDVIIDSRKVTANAIFIAIKGDNFDAHDFSVDVLKSGAKILIIDNEQKDKVMELIKASSIHLHELQNIIAVDNPKVALAQIAALVRGKSNARFVALTGSSGKTSVKEMVLSILSNEGKTLATAGNYNNEIGVPLTLLRLQGDEQYAVIELGANHQGEIAYTAAITRPEAVLINSIAPAHLEGFGSLAGIARAKSEIFTYPTIQDFKQLTMNSIESLHSNDDLIAIMNADILSSISDEQTQFSSVEENQALVRFWHEIITKQPHLDFFSVNRATVSLDGKMMSVRFIATEISLTAQGSIFLLNTPIGQISVQLSLLGYHAISNAVAAASLAFSVGASLGSIKAGLEAVLPVKGRLYPTILAHTEHTLHKMVDDSYNANVGSMKAAIDTLATETGYRIFVVGDMAEMGDYSEDAHREIGHYATQKNIDAVFSHGRFSRIISSMHPNGLHFETKIDLIHQLQVCLKQNSFLTFIVKGSRSAAMEDIVNAFQEK